MNEEFNKWWDNDLLTEDNPFVDGTPAYWAWEGWCAKAALEKPDFWEGYVPEPVKPAQQKPVQRYSPNGEGGMEIDSLGAWVKFIPPQPAQRTWVGLTDEEFDEATAYANPHCDEWAFAKAIEAILREKNS